MPENPATTFDEASMERSMSFINALQELKNLRPQLYSAAEYCEKSYLHNEQKQMVLDNLKDYAVRALVNAVDHLGTVAYKLNDLFEKETSDVSVVGLKISCLNQRLLTCQTYTDKEGLRQQRLQTVIPRHHKHYILPNSVNKKVQFSPQIQIDFRQRHLQAKARPHPSDSPASKTLSWHLASDNKSVLNGTPQASQGIGECGAARPTSRVFHLLGGNPDKLWPSFVSGIETLNSTWFISPVKPNSEEASSTLALNHNAAAGASRTILGTFGATGKDSSEATKSLLAFRSFDAPGRRETSHPPVRSKSMLSAFFVKHKSAKRKADT